MLPSWDGQGTASPRYGNVAVSILLQKLLGVGANRAQLRAKIFGGGCLFDSLRELNSNNEHHLGRPNIEIALEKLAKAQIPVGLQIISVNRGPSIVYRTDTGGAVGTIR